MGIMTYEMLKQYAEGVSGNGSEGLGGHGEGFEIQNQGVTRRMPGEGPKVNGGRSQSQEMDSMDQPQYKLREMFAVDEADEKEIEKASKKEKGEHPWATKKQARQIAKDHLKEGKASLKEAFIIKEMPVYKKAAGEEEYTDQATGKKYNLNNIPYAGLQTGDGYHEKDKERTIRTGADAEKHWKETHPSQAGKRPKPPLEDVIGKFLVVTQFAQIPDGLNYNEITDEDWASMSPGVYPSKQIQWGNATYQVQQDGSLKFVGADYDSSG